MKLEGSCHCGAVKYSVESRHPHPFNRCYCSICRKTDGGGGYAINLGADAETLKVNGEEHITVYQATLQEGENAGQKSPAERRFCRHCGSTLWVWDPRWPDHLHPFASAIDSVLPAPPETTHLMLGSKASWVTPCLGENDKTFERYPDESIAAWHERLGLVVE